MTTVDAASTTTTTADEDGGVGTGVVEYSRRRTVRIQLGLDLIRRRCKHLVRLVSQNDGGGQVLECSLAKPQADQKTVGVSNLHKACLLPGYPSGAGYGLVRGRFSTIGAGYGAAGFAQERI